MKKKVLYIGPYKQNDGWGIAAREYIRAIATTCDVKPFFVRTNVNLQAEFDEFKDLENQSFDSYDAVIQNLLPVSYCYDRRFGKNIGLMHYEADLTKLDINKYRISCGLMDQIWGPNRCGFADTKIIPIPTDVTKYEKDYPIPEYIPRNTFNIYFIGECISRKNIESLIIAFHTAFSRKDDVNLIIKTNKNVGISNKDLFSLLRDEINQIKMNLGMYANLRLYRQEILVAGAVPEEELYGIHQGCHMLIVPSSGESQCMPYLDAVGFGNLIGTVKGTGPSNIFRHFPNRVPIESDYEPIYCLEKPVKTLYTGNEMWYKPSVASIAEAMNTGYMLYKAVDGKKDRPKNEEVKNTFSYTAVGEKINEYLSQ